MNSFQTDIKNIFENGIKFISKRANQKNLSWNILIFESKRIVSNKKWQQQTYVGLQKSKAASWH